MTPEPFDPRPDETLGRLLREHLAPAGEAGFLARMRAAVARERRDASSWEVLAAWARPGLAAAVLLAVLLGLWLTRPAPATDVATLDDAMRPADAPAALLESPQPPTPDAVLLAGLEAP